MRKKIVSFVQIVALMIGLVTGFGNQVMAKGTEDDASTSRVQKSEAAADLYNAKNEKIGTAHFTETKEGVKINIMASNLPPTKHGFHIHEIAKCVAPDFKSAGDHFNPGKREHGFDNPKGFHAGDLPNLEVNRDGMSSATAVTKNVTLQKGKANSLFDKDGSSIVIHEKADDYKTDPAGASGARVACGVIKPVQNR